MRADAFLYGALVDCFLQVYGGARSEAEHRVARVKFTGRNADRYGRGPSILWWVSYLEREPWIDGAAPANGIGFRIECRAETIDQPTGAAFLLDCVLERLAPYLIAVEDQSDEEDSPSQQRLDYFACVARVVLPERIEVG